jgi:hypothetical protein
LPRRLPALVFAVSVVSSPDSSLRAALPRRLPRADFAAFDLREDFADVDTSSSGARLEPFRFFAEDVVLAGSFAFAEDSFSEDFDFAEDFVFAGDFAPADFFDED